MVNGDVPPKVKKDAHALILEFIRSRPPLKKVCTTNGLSFIYIVVSSLRDMVYKKKHCILCSKERELLCYCLTEGL